MSEFNLNTMRGDPIDTCNDCIQELNALGKRTHDPRHHTAASHAKAELAELRKLYGESDTMEAHVAAVSFRKKTNETILMIERTHCN